MSRTDLAGTVGTGATDTGDTGDSTTSTPRFCGGLVTSLLAYGVGLTLVLRDALCSSQTAFSGI